MITSKHCLNLGERVKKSEVTAAVSDAKENTRMALQTVYDVLNYRQRKKDKGRRSCSKASQLKYA